MIEKVIMINNSGNYKCIFCSIINGTSEGITVYDNNHFFVLMDKYPISNGHTLVIPKIHYNNLLSIGILIFAAVLAIYLFYKIGEEKGSVQGIPQTRYYLTR